MKNINALDRKLREAAEDDALKPPWILFHSSDGRVDILPAGRCGEVVNDLPEGLAAAIVGDANAQHQEDELRTWESLADTMERVTASMKGVTCVAGCPFEKIDGAWVSRDAMRGIFRLHGSDWQTALSEVNALPSIKTLMESTKLNTAEKRKDP